MEITEIIEKTEILGNIANVALAVINLALLAVAIITLCIALSKYYDNKSETEKARAPRLVITSVKLQKIGGFKFTSEFYTEPENQEFLVGKRRFHAVNDKGKFIKNSSDIGFCLVMNACPAGSTANATEVVNHNLITLANIGFDAIGFSIDKITYELPVKRELVLRPKEKYAQNQVVQRIDSGHPIKVYISSYFNSQSGIFDKNLLDSKNFLKGKLEQADSDGEILGSTFPLIADTYDKIVIDITSRNLYNESYTQQLTIEVVRNEKNATFFTHSNEPTKEKSVGNVLAHIKKPRK